MGEETTHYMLMYLRNGRSMYKVQGLHAIREVATGPENVRCCVDQGLESNV